MRASDDAGVVNRKLHNDSMVKGCRTCRRHAAPCSLLSQWMAAVDTIITKAGPGTIAEALISGLPILLNGNVPCQVRTVAGHGIVTILTRV